jgi:hypothetical protein
VSLGAVTRHACLLCRAKWRARLMKMRTLLFRGATTDRKTVQACDKAHDAAGRRSAPSVKQPLACLRSRCEREPCRDPASRSERHAFVRRRIDEPDNVAAGPQNGEALRCVGPVESERTSAQEPARSWVAPRARRWHAPPRRNHHIPIVLVGHACTPSLVWYVKVAGHLGCT